jgi:hypothetical protein
MVGRMLTYAPSAGGTMGWRSSMPANDIEFTDRTLVALMAAIIFSSCKGTTEGAVEKAMELLELVEGGDG